MTLTLDVVPDVNTPPLAFTDDAFTYVLVLAVALTFVVTLDATDKLPTVVDPKTTLLTVPDDPTIVPTDTEVLESDPVVVETAVNAPPDTPVNVTLPNVALLPVSVVLVKLLPM